MRLRTVLTTVLLTGAAHATLPGPVQPGQTWVLAGTTAEGEQFRTTLHLAASAPTGTPATYRANRGVLILDAARGTLIALDLLDARQGGVGLACTVTGPLDTPTLHGLLASGTLEQLPPQLETALAALDVTRTAQERAQAAAELRLGTCTLTPTP